MADENGGTPPVVAGGPGKGTTEFLLVLIPIGVGLVFLLWGMFKGDTTAVERGVTMLLGGTGIYGVSRGLTKLGAGIGVSGSTTTTPEAAAKAVSKV